MNNPYDLRSWSEQYREEVLREVKARNIICSTRLGGVRFGRVRAALIWSSMLSLLGRTELVE